MSRAPAVVPRADLSVDRSISIKLSAADDGPGSQPGTFLGRVAVTATGIPVFPQVAVFDFDLRGLDIRTTTENVFAGVSWFPDNDPGVFLCTDENGGGMQPLFASGDLGGTWLDLRTDPATSSIDALVVRVTALPGVTVIPTLGEWALALFALLLLLLSLAALRHRRGALD